MRQLIVLLLPLFITLTANAQGYVDQDKVKPLLNSQGSTAGTQTAEWKVYDYTYKKGDKSGPWTALKAHLDSLPGERTSLRLEIVELANRVTSDNLKSGRKLFVPTSFPEDYRAFSPYPLTYEAARDLPKLFIIDKFTQTFGAYENGHLVRWGIVSTGKSDNLTPTGKYQFHWRAKFRESSAAPPGEVWEMYYLVNFEPRIGLHVHQYALPIGYPVSHGCVRVAMADAIWNYNWADGTDKNKKGTPVWVINHNPPGRPAHWGVTSSGTVYSLVRLPGESGVAGSVSK